MILFSFCDIQNNRCTLYLNYVPIINLLEENADQILNLEEPWKQI